MTTATAAQPEVDRALDTLRPLLAPELARDAVRGRLYEYGGDEDDRALGAGDATGELEGLVLNERLAIDVDGVMARITTEWIERQVESAILQSAPERLLAELARTGRPGAIIWPPPAALAELRVPALTFAPLVGAVDASARRLAGDLDQQGFRARTLVAVGRGGRPLDRACAFAVAGDVGDQLRLEGHCPDERSRGRLAELARDHARRRRYAAAFAIAARRLLADGVRPDAPRLFRAFHAAAGLDKKPFRRGPSEHLTPELLAHMAVEFYRALADPDYVVSFVMLTFPMKNSSGLRTNTATEAADFGEVLMLAQLRRLLEFLKALGLPNVRFICLSDGLVYSQYLGPYPRLQPIFYRENIRRFRDALGLAGRVLIVDAANLVRRVPDFDGLLLRVRRSLDRAEADSPRVRDKLATLIRSFLFHIHARDEDVELLARAVNACLQGGELPDPSERAEQRRIWNKAASDARWYAAHLLLMSALDVVKNLVGVPHIRATVHPKPGQFAPAPVNVRDFNDFPYHRKPLLPAGSNPLSLDAYLGINLWADPALRFVDVYVGDNRSPFLAVRT